MVSAGLLEPFVWSFRSYDLAPLHFYRKGCIVPVEVKGEA